jgi:predicted component of type VI protein secretion system
MTAGKKISLTFRIFTGDHVLREERLSLSSVKIGTVSSAHLKLTDEKVSRMHAIVEVHDGAVSIVDLGSFHGTFVNGKKVNKTKLQSGDTIVVGDTRLQIAIGEEAGDEADRFEKAADFLVTTAKLASPTEPRKAIELLLLAAISYCRRDLKMSTKEACDSIDTYLGTLFEQIEG